MTTLFPKEINHIPKWFIINAEGLTLGKLSTEISLLLRGKKNSFFTPGIDQGNFVIVINASKITYTGKKDYKKLYYRNSQRPGSLKIEKLKDLKSRNSARIIEKSVWGMLPKGILGRIFYNRLYVYSTKNIKISKTKIENMKFIKPYSF
jgi:large subunit ribosomal protein L13